jgi:CubicO group peptidase (beta-lactamase class C family)
MNKPVRAIVIAFACCFPLTSWAADPLPRAKPEDVGMSSERLALIAKAVNSEIASGQLPGAVIGIARRGKLIYFEAFGYRDKAAGAPMTTDAIFSIASMTKPIVAVAALQLYERGQLLMDDPLDKYLPKFSDMRVATFDQKNGSFIGTVPASRKITIQDLLRHTSGLSYGTNGATELHKMYPPSSNFSAQTFSGEQFVNRLSSLPLHQQPGSVWEYSFGFDVVGLVIESITGQPLGQYLETNLWRPLGMRDTSFAVPDSARYAREFPVDPTSGSPQSIPLHMEKIKFQCGGGCIVSTAGDYLRFAYMLVNRGKLGDERILGRKTIEYMLSDQLGSKINKDKIGVVITNPIHADYGFGLGVAVRTTPGVARPSGSVGDFSWPGAFGTYWWGDPSEQLAVVWMAHTPGSPSVRSKFAQMIRALVYQAIAD